MRYLLSILLPFACLAQPDFDLALALPQSAIPGFTNTTVPNLRWWIHADASLWQDAGKAAAVTADGQPVGYAQDDSGNGYHATNRVADGFPIYVANVINGRPVFRFTQGHTNLSCWASTCYTNTETNIVFTVQRMARGDESETYYVVFGGTNATAPRAVGSFYAHAGEFGYHLYGSGDLYYIGSLGSPAYTNFCVFRSEFMSGANSAIYTNSVLAVAGDAGTSSMNGFFLGNNYNLNVGFYGDIAEILVYGPLEESEKAVVENYLKQKYALP